MLVCGYDTETTGLDTEKDHIIEVGAMLYDTEKRVPLKVYNTFIRPLSPLPAGYVSPTGIHAEWLVRYGVSLPEAFGQIQCMVAATDPHIVVAHNGLNFDRLITLAELKRHNIQGHAMAEAHWVDTRQDIPFEKEPDSRKLKYIACDHNFINPFPHRALFDVSTMMKVVSHYNFEEILALSKVPLITVRALTNYDQRQLAKDARFNWNGERKIWTKEIRENTLEREVAAAAEKGFEIVRI